ncbi:1-acyl-sn-glycerol-3-phosphate acyltransferase [Candidatus Woesearchaeota archaeon]|nr:1-acyl-sn-glycerol-3-phosphate acyltransferase [Candidatus Woesearchaeota archaeon]
MAPTTIQRMLARLVKASFLRKAKGIENIPKDKAFILAANHNSYIDHMIINAVAILHLNKMVSFLAKKEHFEGGFQRQWHVWFRAIPIDRQAGGKEALKKAIKHLRKGGLIGIYPEGTRSSTGKIQRGKTGVARLAVFAKVPVIPVGIKGTFDILPKGKLIPKPKRAEMSIGKPIYLDKYYGQEENRKVIRRITDNIMKEIARLSKQKYNF